jgi:hypothetical protein
LQDVLFGDQQYAEQFCEELPPHMRCVDITGEGFEYQVTVCQSLVTE